MKYPKIKVFAVIIMIIMVDACVIDENLSFNVKDDVSKIYNPPKEINPFIKNQLLVIYKGKPTEETIDRVKNRILEFSPGATVKRCNKCDETIEMWEGDSIESYIHHEIVSGTRSTEGVGEDSIAYYSSNFTVQLPKDQVFIDITKFEEIPEPTEEKKDEVIVGILDTGRDRRFIPKKYLWENENYTDCYSGDNNGWNFITDTASIDDDNEFLHGTLINGYIINQFQKSPHNSVKLMNLKTHDSDGVGNLFSIICAINYAREKGANIINASWGFYEYGHEGKTHPYLDSLITTVLRSEGILFITASGNKMDDNMALEMDIVDPRDINQHHFYPAYLGNTSEKKLNNIITVTTIDTVRGISPTQNYSVNHVDFGVQADKIFPKSGYYQFFEVPFQERLFTRGSSYATAIAAGKIGAYLPVEFYRKLPEMDKGTLMNLLSGLMDTEGEPIIHKKESLSGKIKYGRYIKK